MLGLVVVLERLGKVGASTFAEKRELDFKRGSRHADIMFFANMV
ncbi:hypothetical protein [Sulfurisphaera ohwakuensis]|nr:hypothetical protein [Sulfurisphaera ohwakuensis]